MFNENVVSIPDISQFLLRGVKMTRGQIRLVRRLIAEYDNTYVEDGERSRMSSHQDDMRHEAGEKIDVARAILGFRTESALRKAVGAPKAKED